MIENTLDYDSIICFADNLHKIHVEFSQAKERPLNLKIQLKKTINGFTYFDPTYDMEVYTSYPYSGNMVNTETNYITYSTKSDIEMVAEISHNNYVVYPLATEPELITEEMYFQYSTVEEPRFLNARTLISVLQHKHRIKEHFFFDLDAYPEYVRKLNV